MKYLVTGGCGFIGSHFINWIHKTESDAFILNIDHLDYCSDIDNVKDKDSSWYQFVQLDIKHFEKLHSTIKSFEPDFVVHFAAQSHVDNSFGNSLDFTLDNVYGTHCLFEALRLVNNTNPIQKIIHISTDECYGEVNLDSDPCDENSLLNPSNPYAASKAGAEFVVRSYILSFKLPIMILRMNNVFGENQYQEKVIPKFIFQILNDTPITIHGRGEARRCFIYVDNICSAIKMILEKGTLGQIYNVGSEDELSVMQIAELLSKKLKQPLKIEFVEDRIFNDKRYWINSDKIKKLGWKPEISFEDGLNKTIESWIKKIH